VLNFQRTTGGRTYWTCSIRGKTRKCHASVKQFGDVFTPSINGHEHPADPGALKKVKIAAKVSSYNSLQEFIIINTVGPRPMWQYMAVMYILKKFLYK
jgi:hypothetical protein